MTYRPRRWPALFAPAADQRFKIVARLRDQRRIVDFVAQPTAAGLAKDRAANSKAATTAAAARRHKGLAQRLNACIQTQHHDATAIRIALGDQGIDRRPL